MKAIKIKFMSRIFDPREDSMSAPIEKEETSPVDSATNTNTAQDKCPYPLTIDCLEEILSHLIDDKLTLFSCIMVNSLWLNLCIPFLWSNLFDNFLHQTNQSRLIRTYISCLPIQDKQRLLKYNLNNSSNNKKKFSTFMMQTQQFPIFNYNKRNLIMKPLSRISLNEEPLFFYPKYLKSLNYDKFDFAIKGYCLAYSHQNHGQYKRLVFELLKNLIFNNEMVCLRDLKIKFNHEIESPLHNTATTIMKTSINTFIKLTTLDLSYRYSSETDEMIIPQQISNICTHLSIHSTHIRHLTIYITQKWWGDEFRQQICDPIFKLIRSQKNLKYLSINEFWNNNKCQLNNKYDSVDRLDMGIEYSKQFYQILLQQTSNTLESLQFHDLTQFKLLLNILNHFKRHFSINNNDGGNSIIIHSLISPIIISSNKSLESLSLSEVSRDILLSITNHCPNVSNLSLSLNPSLSPEFCALLMSLSKLQSLKINKSFCNISFTATDLINLANSLPTSLYYFNTDIFDNSKFLNYFLENCNVDLNLSILEVYQNVVDDAALIAVLNYKQKNGVRLREFRYSGMSIMFSTRIWESTKKILPDLVKV
ncbi:6647_t:CDS:2 [Funneliformis caledonium]|uniref:6647_t:CDS:1 n=1 Tax=Funneliformis caledonium TaxID=1117310 RepID=A0A9N9G3M5_9GLOM|nr:6647_t:CDS:2 [Funneliformis caledonium]